MYMYIKYVYMYDYMYMYKFMGCVLLHNSISIYTRKLHYAHTCTPKVAS